MRVIRILPEMNNSHFLSMFHRGISGQWPPSELPWDELASAPPELVQEVALWAGPFALEGERAVRATSRLIPKLSLARATEAQLYLTTLQLDKARQFHVFDRFLKEARAGASAPQRVEIPKRFGPYASRNAGELEDGAARAASAAPRGSTGKSASARPSARRGSAPVAQMWQLYCVTALSHVLLRALQGNIPSTWFAAVAARILEDQARQLPFLQAYIATAISQPLLDSDPEAWSGALRRAADTFGALSDPNLPYARAAERRGVDLGAALHDGVRELELRLDALVADCANDAGEEAQFV